MTIFRFEEFLVFGTLIVIIAVLYFEIGKLLLKQRREKNQKVMKRARKRVFESS